MSTYNSNVTTWQKTITTFFNATLFIALQDIDESEQQSVFDVRGTEVTRSALDVLVACTNRQ